MEDFPGKKQEFAGPRRCTTTGRPTSSRVPLPEGPIDFAYLEEAFGREHEKTYGHRAGADEPVELVTIQVVGQGLREGPSVPERVRPSRPEPTPPRPRRAYFGSWIETPIMRRSDLSQAKKGPLIVEEYDATCVVPPGAKAELDAGGNIVIELG